MIAIMAMVILAGVAMIAGFLKVEEDIKSVQDTVDLKIVSLEGKATYLPGGACVISATAEVTPAEIIHFSRACAKSHEHWLTERQ